MKSSANAKNAAFWRANAVALKDAIVAGGTVFILSCLLSVLVVLGLYLNFPPSKWIEREGVDVSFRLLSQFPSLLKPETEGAGEKHQVEAARPNYVFYDVDLPTCRAFAKDKVDCLTHNPVNPGVIREFAAYLLTTTAKAIVFDSKFDLDVPEEAALVDELISLSIQAEGEARRANRTSPYVFIPLELRRHSDAEDRSQPSERFESVNRQWFAAEWVEAHRLYQSKVRFAPSIISTDAEASDGKIRNVQEVVSVQADGKSYALLNLPFALSRLQSSTNPRAASHSQQRIIYTLAPLSQIWRGGCDDNSKGPPRIPECDVQDRLVGEYADIYTYARTGALIADGRFHYDHAALAGATVFVGSSLPSGEDIHLTPIGVMSGAEILTNASRSALQFPGRSEHRGGAGSTAQQAVSDILAKIAAACPAGGVFLLAYMLAGIVNANLELVRPKWGRSGIVRYLVTTTIIGSAFKYIVLPMEISAAVRELNETANHGAIFDTLTPVLALLSERALETAKSVILGIEHLMEKTVEGLFEWLPKSNSQVASSVDHDEVGG